MSSSVPGIPTLFPILIVLVSIVVSAAGGGDGYLPLPETRGPEGSFPVPVFDWDLVVGHGANLTLIKFNNKLNKDVILVKELLMNNTINSFDVNSKMYLNKKTQISYLASSVNENGSLKIFYSHEFPSEKFTDLNMYDTATEQSSVLLHKSDMTYDDLLYFNNSLYWIDTFSNNLMVLNLEMLIPEPAVPKVLVNLGKTKTAMEFGSRNVKFGGLAVDPNTGYLFWSIWPRQSFSIDYFNKHIVQTLLTSNLFYPTSLTIGPDSTLYWTNKPSNQLLIEKVQLVTDKMKGLVDARNRSQVYSSGLTQNLFSFIVLPFCPGPGGDSSAAPATNTFLIATDTKSQTVFSIATKNEKTSVLLHYIDSIPNGLTLLNRNSQAHCKALNTDEDVVVVNSVPNNSSPDSREIVVVPKVLDNNNTVTMGPIFSSCNTLTSRRCLNGGSCFLYADSKEFCLCQNGWTGPNCELEWINSSNTSVSQHNTYRQDQFGSTGLEDTLQITVISLAAIVGLLVLVIVYLGFKVCRLDKKPKIHRRLVVSRNANQSDSAGGQAVCEMIDIENCCNMNICETPCYETGHLLGNATGSKAITNNSSTCTLESEHGYSCEFNSKKLKEDKERLLD